MYILWYICGIVDYIFKAHPFVCFGIPLLIDIRQIFGMFGLQLIIDFKHTLWNVWGTVDHRFQAHSFMMFVMGFR